MNINEQIQNLIASAQNAGLTSSELASEIMVRWQDGATQAPALKLDDDGRHTAAGSTKLWLSPIPIKLGMKLTKRQMDNITTNCGVDTNGDPVAAFGRGFKGETGENFPVSMLSASNQFEVPAGKTPPRFTPVTRSARFTTMADLVAYIAREPWVQ